MSAVVFVLDPLYPDVHGESSCPCEREKHYAVGDLGPNAVHGRQSLIQFFVREFPQSLGIKQSGSKALCGSGNIGSPVADTGVLEICEGETAEFFRRRECVVFVTKRLYERLSKLGSRNLLATELRDALDGRRDRWYGAPLRDYITDNGLENILLKYPYAATKPGGIDEIRIVLINGSDDSLVITAKIQIGLPDLLKFFLGAGERKVIISEISYLKIPAECDELDMGIVYYADPERLAGISNLQKIHEINLNGYHCLCHPA